MTAPTPGPQKGTDFWALCLATLGVVYGDIGTSPIYAIRESFHTSHGIAATQANTYGILSLIFWSLIVVISLKYLVLVMRADNRGEGGIIALTALVMPRQQSMRGRGPQHVLVLVGLFGAALLYGDSMITPAISVLSAVEGLEVAVPSLTPWVLPLTVGILVGLFAFQRRGTGGVGIVFGPVTLLWFLTLAVLGVAQIAQHPAVLASLNPWHAVRFFHENGARGILVLGSVFLVVTGGEALYADMGHFGKRPIRLTWMAVVLPSLVLNYFGQGALIIADPEVVEHPFFSMAPEWAAFPLVALATAATVIASQAVISGAFSLTRQAVQLGYLPRLRVDHTSHKHIGQIYMPAVNWALMLACIGLVLGFRTSGQPGRRLRRGRHHRHGLHDDPLRRGRPPALPLEAAVDRAARRRAAHRGPRVLGRQPAEDPQRRLVPTPRRAQRVHADDHVEARAGRSSRRSSRSDPCPCGSSCAPSSGTRHPACRARRSS